ncbi:SpvB/TcaC N-terminal domain-containing protein [Shewanella sp. YLB-07]|uniref:SpvB/TcaC N-terminal domain-containing protein n=1 Tax=Shewanella sp. YLB-07 TaxID=2601268 RepID=UPI001883C867|nr:SpvB/TcaC N-terminal domain-containing protein [Shewanella sp. YLB-07]
MSQQTANLAINPPQLPQQGGTINTAQTTPGHAGPTGDLQFSIPLPVSGGRGLVPSLALSYQTSQGNGPFGVGWQLPLLSIRLHTKHGTPQYDDTDRYVGPSGEVLEPERDEVGGIVSQTCNSFGTTAIDEHIVVSYRSRVAGGYERYERWQLASDAAQIFWLVFGLDGSLHCLGKSALAQTALDGRIAQWSIEESLSPQGEHIRYVYTAENSDGVDTEHAPEDMRQRGALSYLTQVLYGNVTASDALYCLKDNWPDDKTGWLFSVVLDYGQRSQDTSQSPEWSTETPWPARQDPFSDYHYGFEVRCHRQCHQILMFHHFADELTHSPMLVRRLMLGYDDNPVLSRLISAQEWAYGEDSKHQPLIEFNPALQIGYQAFVLPDASAWQTLAPTPGINESPFYQLVDLYGEGVSGVLYRSGTDWRYRAPQRAEVGGDAITYSEWHSVASVPTLQDGRQVLTDVTGDGRLDWMVLHPGLNGFFTLNDDKTWQSFTPFSAVPSELLSGEGMFADITGAGLADVAVIGPNSVRFYPNTRRGFAPGLHASLDSLHTPLPIQGRNARTLVAFSDMLGAGQAQLIEVDEGSVRCWPNLGQGRFGEAITLSWPGVENFQPGRLYLVDIDGSGANDLIYAQTDKLTVFCNQSGNGFAAGLDLFLPEGVRFDDTCQLTFDDLQGTGGMAVLLSVPHLAPAHYRLTLSAAKPYLLNQLDNQCGAVSQVTYRHSGQEWLDEKTHTPQAHCTLPIPLYLVKQLTQVDTITGNQLTQHFVYRQGLYDGLEREYRGFGYVESLDTQVLASPRPDTDTPPLQTCRWYHVGQSQPQAPAHWLGDDAAYGLQDTALSGWNAPLSASESWWVERALTGSLLREEVYGLDDSALQGAPYSVQSLRYQVVQLQAGADDTATPTLRVQPLEQLSYHYERISHDPSCQHSVTLAFDEYGAPTHEITVNYPRRAVGEGVWDAIYPVADKVDTDEQQFTLRLNESLSAYLQQETACYSVIGLPFESRSNVIEGQGIVVPEGGFSVETLQALVDSGLPATFAGQQQIHYVQEEGDVDFSYPPRVESVAVAALDEVALAAYADVLSATELASELVAAGYLFAPRVLPLDADNSVWVARQSYTRYLEAEAFYLPVASRTTHLVEESLVTYDAYYVAVTSAQDALGNVSTATVNYQQLQPHTLTDVNLNTQQVAVSPLGVPVSSAFYGNEGGASTGFPPLADSIMAPLDVTTLIEEAGTVNQQEATLFARNTLSWQSEPSLPLHQVALIADDYPEVDTQQVQVQLAYSDGFDRALQSVQKVAPGRAYRRTAEGELEVDENGQLIESQTETRWQVSGRVEYNNKGQVVRQYQPYFVDDWRYVSDTAMRAQGVADTHYYDALGREVKVVTAKGFERRQYYTPWFTVAEDENDTWSEVTSESR